jgi:threonine dehydrogenase-like Zn-dependent dehydrogenase
VITHHLPLEQAPEGFAMFNDKSNDCIKIVLKPGIH